MKKIIPLLLIFLIWECLAFYKIIDPSFYPRPSIILSTLYNQVFAGTLFLDLLHSLYRLFYAILIAVPLAYLVSLLSAHCKIVDNFVNPIILFTYPLPKVAIFPFLLLIFGIADKSKIAMIAIGIFYLVLINTREGMLNLLKSDLVSIIKVYHPSRINYLYNFIFKGSFRHFFIGIITGINYGLTLVVVSEFNLSNNGIGNYIWKSWDQFRIEEMYAGIFLLCLTGFAINVFLDEILKKFLIGFSKYSP